MTQPELAKKLNVSTSTVAHFECGCFKSSLEILDKLREVFNIPLDDLIYKDLSKL